VTQHRTRCLYQGSDGAAYARNPNNYFVYLRHNETANVAFCDGHAKAQNEGYVTNPAYFDLN